MHITTKCKPYKKNKKQRMNSKGKEKGKTPTYRWKDNIVGTMIAERENQTSIQEKIVM